MPTFTIETVETALALALRKRVTALGRGATRSPRSLEHQPFRGGLAVRTDRPTADLLGAVRDALREAGVEATTVWAGGSGVDLFAAMDDARIASTALLLSSLNASSQSGQLPGVPYS